MTDKEMAVKYAECEQCTHCINPQHCPGKDDCYDFAEVMRHFLAGLKASRLKWHFVDKESLPEDKYKVFVQHVNGDYDIAFKFGGTWRGTSGNELKGVYAWREIVPPKSPKEE